MMLGQLICLDRRYQRMNCFNIREAQALLKKRFFVDLINSNDHHVLLSKTMLGLRFKTQDLSVINANGRLASTFGLSRLLANRPFAASTTVENIQALPLDAFFSQKLLAASTSSKLFSIFSRYVLEIVCFFQNPVISLRHFSSSLFLVYSSKNVEPLVGFNFFHSVFLSLYDVVSNHWASFKDYRAAS